MKGYTMKCQKDMNAQEIAEMYRAIPKYDRETASTEIAEILVGELTDQLCKEPYRDLDTEEFTALLTAVRI